MAEKYLDIYTGGRVPSGLPGGWFIYEADDDEKILFAEPSVMAMYGCSNFGEFLRYVGGSFRGMVHPDDLHRIENQIQAQTVFGEKRHDYVRYRIITRSGEVRYVEDFGHLLTADDGKKYFYVFVVDVDKNEYHNRRSNSYAEAELLSDAQDTDPLTGLFNMSFFYNQTQLLLNSRIGKRSNIALVHFDIPNFKLYNERHGFKMGDELLCDLAKTIRKEFEGGTVARFSDDHFFVCTTGDKEEVVEKVQRVYKDMLLSDDINKKVRLKAGIYLMDDRYAEVGLACDHARLACNSIKGRHDVNYCIYDEILRDRLRRQQYVVDHIEEAVEQDLIKVYYQPVIRVKTGEICGYEALVRWSDPNLGILRPMDFVETLEQFHLIHLVDKFVISKVCEDIKELEKAGEQLVPISINISRLDFELCDIFGVIESTRERYGVPRDMIDLEITESALIHNEGYIKDECEKMKELGYHIWLDDFGSGYSSLNTLAEYDFDVLKLDLIFLRNLGKNPKTETIMTYIIRAALEMGLSPLCEGVETAAHYEFLKAVGCERAQGFYFGKPMPMDETRAYTRGKGMKWEKYRGR